MRKSQRRATRAEYRGRKRRQVRNGVTLLFMVSVAAVALMAVVNHMPMGNRYTYTSASDLWLVDDGEMQISAPELILFTPTPSPTAEPTPTVEPSATPEPEDGPEEEPGAEPATQAAA